MASVYKLTQSINNKIFRFGILYGRMSSVKNIANWRKSLSDFMQICSGVSAVSLNKNIFEKIDPLKFKKKDLKTILTAESFKEFQVYVETKDFVVNSKERILSLDFLLDVHGKIMQDDDENRQFRKSKRLLPKEVSGHGVVRHIEFEVKTLPANIPQKLNNFIHWFAESKGEENPLVLAAISHFKIAEIHPFADGNGRLSRVLEYFALKDQENIFEISALIAPEYYHLVNSERYYDLLDSCIESEDLTPWLEFYTENLLNAITDSAKLIYRFSGGSVDILNNIVIELSELEEKVVAAMIESPDDGGPAEIGEKLGYSRQNIYRALRSLNAKGLLAKISKITGVKYRVK